jgi:hypothetical protein
MPLPVTFTVNAVPVPPTQTLLEPVGVLIIGAVVVVKTGVATLTVTVHVGVDDNAMAVIVTVLLPAVVNEGVEKVPVPPLKLIEAVPLNVLGALTL